MIAFWISRRLKTAEAVKQDNPSFDQSLLVVVSGTNICSSRLLLRSVSLGEFSYLWFQTMVLLY